jgi:hypothetical protein
MRKTSFRRSKRVETGFENEPWSIAKLEWFKGKFNTGLEAYQFLAQIGWFPIKRNCPKCEGPMVINRMQNSADGVTWKCNNQVSERKQKKKTCGTRISIRDGTWASNAHLTIPEIIQHNFLWYSK